MCDLPGLADPAINWAGNGAMIVNDTTGARLEGAREEAVKVVVFSGIFSLGDGHVDLEMVYKYTDQAVLYQ